MNRIAIVAVLLLATGCASVPMAPASVDSEAKQFKSIPDQANIYVYRNEGIGAAIKMGIYADEQPIAQTAAKTFINFQLAPGAHTIRGHAENNSEVTLDAKGGELYFIWQEVKMGFASARNKLQIMDADEGKAGVQECKLVAPK